MGLKLDLFMMFFSFFMMITGVLISVAYFTLLERNGLGYIQLRKGPNKLGFMGLLQPFSDAIKLFTKENSKPLKSNIYPYYISPMFAFLLALVIWSVFPMINEFISFQWSIMFFFVITSLSVYTIMIAGWSSNSIYSMLGGLRSMAQTISYEVSLMLILLYFVILMKNFSVKMFLNYQYYMWFMGVGAPLMIIWLVTSLAETNRTPFDLAEGESELVSGFNVEYSAGGFALIFLAEYSMIIFMSGFMIIMCLGGFQMKLMFFFKMSLLSFIYIWVRGTLPRFRYDKIMALTWKSYLPISLNFLFFGLGVLMILF